MSISTFCCVLGCPKFGRPTRTVFPSEDVLSLTASQISVLNFVQLVRMISCEKQVYLMISFPGCLNFSNRMES